MGHRGAENHDDKKIVRTRRDLPVVASCPNGLVVDYLSREFFSSFFFISSLLLVNLDCVWTAESTNNGKQCDGAAVLIPRLNISPVGILLGKSKKGQSSVRID